MIFATVGTHEQPMDRLFAALERLPMGEETFVQSGPTRYRFARATAVPFLDFEAMQAKMREARVVVSHGGPATILQVRAAGKVPIVVPRQPRYGEHVDGHQIAFCKRLERAGLVLAVYDIDDLDAMIAHYEERAGALPAIGDARASAFGEDTRGALCERLAAYCGAAPPGA